ncbi:C6 finger domain containing protein [Seiridium cupressi]
MDDGLLNTADVTARIIPRTARQEMHIRPQAFGAAKSMQSLHRGQVTDHTPTPAYHQPPFASQDAAALHASASSLYDFSDLEPNGTLTPAFFSSSEDGVDIPSFLDASIGTAGLELLHTTSDPSPPSTEGLEDWMSQAVSKPPVEVRDAVLKHSMRTTFRVLRSWPRMLAKGFQLPPIIHLLQFKDGTPRPLTNCIALCKMWSGQCDDSTRPMFEDAVRKEVDIILSKYRSYDQPTLLAALQAIIIYLLLLIFPTPNQTSQSLVAPSLFNQVQTLGYFVASTGLILHEESTRAQPVWAIWSHVEAKRRSMCSLYLVHWAYSVYHSQVRFDCGRELARMPGPGAKFLWNATDEQSWNTLYTRWLAQWDEGRDFMFAEFVGIDPEVVMNRRAEIWLEDADELGFLMLSLATPYHEPLDQFPHRFSQMRNSMFLFIVHLRERLTRTWVLKAGMPSISQRTSRRHDRPIHPTLKQHRLMTRAFAVAQGGHSLCALVGKACQHEMQLLRPHGLEEELDIGPRHPVHGLEAQCRVID